MPEIILTFSAKPEELPLIDQIDKIAQREKRSRSFIIKEALAEYAKVHGSGNPAYTLDEFEKGAAAYPTAWGAIGTEDLKPYSWQDEDDMVGRLTSAIANIKRDRQAKRDAEVRAKGLR